MPPDPFITASAQVGPPSGLRTEPPASDRQVSFPDDQGVAGLLELLAIKPYAAAKDAFATEYLTVHLGLNGGNVSRTAASIGLERSALQKKLATLGLVRKTVTKTEIVSRTFLYRRTVKAGTRWVQKDQKNGAI